MTLARCTMACSALAYLALWAFGWMHWGIVSVFECTICIFWAEMDPPNRSESRGPVCDPLPPRKERTK